MFNNYWRFLGAAALTALAPAVEAATVRWTGATDSNWSTSSNWDGLSTPGSTDDVVFDATGSYPANLRVQLDGDFTIGTLSVSGDFDPNAAYNFEPLERITNRLTITGGALSVDIPTTGSTNKTVEFDSEIGFTNNLKISRTGNATSNNRRVIFNRGLVRAAPGLSVTINNQSNSNRNAIRFRDALAWVGSTTIEQGVVELFGDRVDPTFGDAGSTVTTATTGDTTILMNRNAAAGDATTENNFVLGTAGTSRFVSTGGGSTAETWTITGDFSGGATGVDLALDMDSNDHLRLSGDIDVNSRLLLQNPGGTVRGTVFLDGRLVAAAGGVTIQNNATLGGNGSLLFRIDSGTATSFGGSPIDANGTLDISGLTLEVVELNGGVDGLSDYVIADYTGGSLVGSAFASVVGLPAGYQVDTEFAGGTQLALVVVPEPATIILISFGLLGWWRHVRS